VHVTAALDAPCSPTHAFPWVEDLTRYPQWLSIITRVQPVDGDAWLVDLRGHLGPLARSKRLRMVRSRHELDRAVTFERDEQDGRKHSPWVLRAEVSPTDAGCHVVMHLDYGGGMWGPLIERLLDLEIAEGRRRLLELLSLPMP